MIRTIGAMGAALLAVAGGGAASAQVTGIVTDREIYNQVGVVPTLGPLGPTVQTTSTQNVQVANGAVQNNFIVKSNGGSGAPVTSITNYQLSTEVDNAAGYIGFASNATVSGNYAQMSVGTSVAVTYTNAASTALPVTLSSTITPAGFGIYVADPSGNTTGGDINRHPEAKYVNFQSIAAGGYYTGNSGPIATSQVSFQILSGTTTVASYDASLRLMPTPDGKGGYAGVSPQLAATGWMLDAAGTLQPLTLNNFGLIDADDPNKAIGYRWDATDVSLALGTIGAGESRTLTYVTRVESDISSGYFYPVGQLLAYAGFGDPIGEHAGAGGIADPDFPLIKLATPQFGQSDSQSDGGLTIAAATFGGYTPAPLALQQVDGGAVIAAVPEPASWAMVAVGIGFAGGAMRRRPRAGRSALRTARAQA